MDETTRRDAIAPLFDHASPPPPAPSPASSPGVLPEHPTTIPASASALITAGVAGEPLPVNRPTAAAASLERPTAPQPPPFDRPTSPTAPRSPVAGEATGLTYASKIPVDAPGLQLEKPRPRTLRQGPVLSSIAIVSGAVIIALVVALSPRSEPAKAAGPTQTDAPKDITLPDNVRDAPESNAGLHPAPRLGPAGGKPAPRVYSEPNNSAREAARQAIRDERAKALASPILVDLEPPTPPDQAHLAGGPSSAAAASGPDAPVVAPALGLSPTSVADPNQQQHKSEFLSRDGISNISYLAESLAQPHSPYEVKAGTIIPTSLITGMNSDLPGQVIGQVRENVYDTVTGNYLLIPQGSRLLARYDSAVTFGQERLLVCWNRLIRPDGSSIPLECMPGVDLQGQAGFADQVDNHWWRIITGVALGTLISATAQRSQGDVSGYNPTVPQLWAANAGSAVNQAGQAITQKNLGIQPTIRIRPGFSVNVIVSKDIVLSPYVR